jgi:SNF2 family DNA or RNA helicase
LCSGTPIQNKLEDIHSLVHFLGVEPFTSKQAWAQYITKAMKMRAPSGGSIGSARLQTLMKSVTLRRTKFSKINGKPILSLPPRRDHVRILKLDQTEQLMYDRASAQAQKVFKGFEQEGSVLRHYVHLLELILKLRQICTHPKLCKNYEQLLKDDGTDVETWNPERAAHLLGLLRETGDDDCCHCGAIIEGESLPQVSRCGHV